MCRQGAKGDEIIEALIANSATFGKKTSFSQEKYRLKKQKKYAPTVLLRRPFTRSICEAYFKKYPTRIGVKQTTKHMKPTQLKEMNLTGQCFLKGLRNSISEVDNTHRSAMAIAKDTMDQSANSAVCSDAHIHLSRNAIQATERFEAIYPTLKKVALAGSTGSKAMRQVALQTFSFSLKAVGESNPQLSKEAAGISVWCFTQNSECYKQWVSKAVVLIVGM
ncbi:hypothetical protein LINPERHAP1_LOCUS28270 [Linum perenne]